MNDEGRTTDDECRGAGGPPAETLADIVAEMREKTTDRCVWRIFDCEIRRWADRIEKAADRDMLLKARETLQDECRELAAEACRLTDELDGAREEYAESLLKARDEAGGMAVLVRKLCDMVADHPIWRPSEAERKLIAEARKAVGECARIEATEKRT